MRFPLSDIFFSLLLHSSSILVSHFRIDTVNAAASFGMAFCVVCAVCAVCVFMLEKFKKIM